MSLFCILICYGLKHRPFEALNAWLPGVHLEAASACCSDGILTIVTATTPSNATAAIMAITAIEIVFPSSRDESTILFVNKEQITT